MEELLSLVDARHRPVASFVVVFLAVLAAGALVKYLSFRALRRMAERTATDVDDQIVAALQVPSRFWVAIAAIVLAAQELPVTALPAKARSAVVFLLVAAGLISFTLAASRVTLILLRHFKAKAKVPEEITTLTAAIVRALWAIPAALTLLRMANISIAPALTALGVGGLAVAIGLRDTLANLFAGFYVSIAGHFHKGDYVRLNSGEEGFVEDVKWRLTTLRSLQNNLILIPNSKLAEAIVINYNYPEKRMAAPIPVAVSYATDPAHLDRVLLEEVRAAAAEMPDLLLTDPEPVVRFAGFGDSALNFNLVVHVAEFTAQFAVADALRRRILVRFRQEGIEIPFPIRTVQMPRAQDAGA